jgi:RNA polymerase-interacting CarD/CdnL/TRCF family regulator
METQTPGPTPETPFAPGSTVIYGLFGKCVVRAVETRVLGDETIEFYRLEVLKAAASRSTKKEPAIWVPVQASRERGLRGLMDETEIEATQRVLSSREYYFPLDESWSAVHPKLEATIRTGGGPGLAKVVSYLFALKRRQVVPSSEVARLYEQTTRLLIRELSELKNKPPRTIEDELNRWLRHKLLPDS